jgi:hypothetical protein
MVVLRGRVVVMEDDHEDLEIDWNIHVDMRVGVPGCSGRLCPRRCQPFPKMATLREFHTLTGKSLLGPLRHVAYT